LHAGQRDVDGRVQRRITAFEYHARLAAHDNLDPAQLIHSAARTVDILYTNADALDEAAEPREFVTELSLHVVARVGTESFLGCANVDRYLL
jgi:hypothetical protein